MNSLRPRSGYGMSLHESIDYYSYQSEQIDGGLNNRDKLLLKKISGALFSERRRAREYLLEGNLRETIKYDISVEKASNYIHNARIEIGDDFFVTDVYYNYSADNTVRYVRNAKKQPNFLFKPFTSSQRINGYISYLRNNTNWDVIILIMENKNEYRKYLNFIRGVQ